MIRSTPVVAILAAALALAAIFSGHTSLLAYGIFISAVLGAVGSVLMVRSLSERMSENSGLSQEVERLQSEVTRHRDAMDDLADGLDALIFLLDKDLHILYANMPAKQHFRLEQPRGESLVSATLSSELTELVNALGPGTEPLARELTLRHPVDRIVQARVWREGYGHSRVFLSLHDVTDLRRLETVRRDFVANVSHELRTPMTTVRAMAETLQEGDDPELQARYLEKIIREVDRLTHITDDLLTLSIAESGTLARTGLNFSEIVGSVFSQLESKAEGKGLTITLNRPKSLLVQGNETQLVQIVFNLLDNAINYTSEGEININLGETGGQAVLAVSDTGIGIASEHLPRIFERFYRVDKGRSRATGGTGLGLSIVRHLAELHGGSVSVESELNRGTTFTVMIPALAESR